MSRSGWRLVAGVLLAGVAVVVLVPALWLRGWGFHEGGREAARGDVCLVAGQDGCVTQRAGVLEDEGTGRSSDHHWRLLTGRSATPAFEVGGRGDAELAPYAGRVVTAYLARGAVVAVATTRDHLVPNVLATAAGFVRVLVTAAAVLGAGLVALAWGLARDAEARPWWSGPPVLLWPGRVLVLVGGGWALGLLLGLPVWAAPLPLLALGAAVGWLSVRGGRRRSVA